jgi:transglutaminase-like putative cysteine protease
VENAFYYSQMDRDEREAYTAMLACFQSLAPAARVPHLDNAVLTGVWSRLRLDHPEIFYAADFRYSYADGADYVDFRPVYLFEKSKLAAHREALEARVARLVRPVEGAGEEEKELYIHDFMAQNVRYDKLKKEYSHEAFGPLTTGVGVCEGIAKAVKLLCDRLSVGCIVVVSEADPAAGVRYRHAWNLVRLGGAWYHLDATFDNTLSRGGLTRYDYVNLDDGRAFRDHLPSIYPIPACPDGTRFYYRAHRLSLTKEEDAAARVRQALRKKQPQLVLHWRGGFLTREVLNRLLLDAGAAAGERGKFVSCSVNIPQAVLSLRFRDTADPAGPLEENAAAEEEND